jgi:riboflavin biosynthesis pyrimidine reductase
MEPGSLVLEDGTVLPPEPGEAALRSLYEIGPESVRLSLIQARDGGSVGPDGSSRSLNGPEDLRILRVTRSLADIVIVGAETARSERYGDIRLRAALLEARGGAPVHLAIVTRSGRIPVGLNPETTWVLTTAAAVADLGTRVGDDHILTVGDETLNAEELIAALRTNGFSRLLCEGGPSLASTLVEAGVVTDYCLTTSPHDSGPGPVVPAVPERARLGASLEGGGFTMNRWLVP